MAERRGTVEIETDRCKGCGLCVAACPLKILVLKTSSVNSKGYQPAMVNDPDGCTGCGSCSLMCPDSVIAVYNTIRERRTAHV